MGRLRHASRILFAIAVVVSSAAVAGAQTLATTHYGPADGLPHRNITQIFPDSRGFVWFATAEGLSRFDGYGFRRYSTADGLPHLIINDVTEDTHGRLWIATNGGGIARLLDDGDRSQPRRKFVTYRVGDSADTNQVNAILVHDDGSVWCATDAGLFQGKPGPSLDSMTFERKVPYEGPLVPMRGAIDHHRRLWFVMHHELIAIDANGVERYDGTAGWGSEPLIAVTEDAGGRILIASATGVFAFERTEGRAVARRLELPPIGVGPMWVIRGMPDGRVWIGGDRGVATWDGHVIRPVRISGISQVRIVAPDGGGGVWLGWPLGADRLPAESLVRYRALELGYVAGDGKGQLFGVSPAGVRDLSQPGAPLVGGLQSIRGRPPSVLRDRQGNWWVPDADRNAVLRYTPAARGFHREVVIRRDHTFQGFSPAFHEDRTGHVWISVAHFLYRYEAGAQPALTRFNIPAPEEYFRLASTPDGTMWLGSFGGLARVRDGVGTVLPPAAGLPETLVRALFVDSRGWLWVGLRNGGVSVSRDPDALTPTFQNYSTSTGMGSDTVWSITEDRFGQMYLGHGRGVDRLDPITGAIDHLPLPNDIKGFEVSQLSTDDRGDVWMITGGEAVGLTVRPSKSAVPGAVLIDRVQLSGEDVPLSERGLSELRLGDLAAGRNKLRIEYVGLGFGATGLRYQYRLGGVDQDWSPPTDERVVSFANLAPRAYQFAVRGVDRQGRAGQEGTVTFTVLAPIWQRWWFFAGALGLALVSGAAWQRVRVRHLLAVERIRRQVSLDLHDDIGAGLTQIAMLSELAKRERSSDRASEIGDLARSLRDSMSDIVWAIDPRRDHVVDFVRRIRQVSFNFGESSGLAFHFKTPDDREMAALALPTDRRRHLLLMFKEATTNIVRHARASNVHVDLQVIGRDLRLTIRDDGCGFDPSASHAGHGLQNLRTRAGQMGARLVIESTVGAGSTVAIVMTLA